MSVSLNREFDTAGFKCFAVYLSYLPVLMINGFITRLIKFMSSAPLYILGSVFVKVKMCSSDLDLQYTLFIFSF